MYTKCKSRLARLNKLQTREASVRVYGKNSIKSHPSVHDRINTREKERGPIGSGSNNERTLRRTRGPAKSVRAGLINCFRRATRNRAAARLKSAISVEEDRAAIEGGRQNGEERRVAGREGGGGGAEEKSGSTGFSAQARHLDR